MLNKILGLVWAVTGLALLLEVFTPTIEPYHIVGLIAFVISEQYYARGLVQATNVMIANHTHDTPPPVERQKWHTFIRQTGR